MILVNDQFPGPLIEANIGDTISVTVNNQMTNWSTSIHWHGIAQTDTNWMDGVAAVTQVGHILFSAPACMDWGLTGS